MIIRWRRSLFLCMILLIVVSCSFAYVFFTDCFLPIEALSKRTTFILPRHSSLSVFARRVQARGWVKHALSIRVLARVQGVSGRLHFGRYRVYPGMSAADLLRSVVQAKNRVVHALTFVPGSSFATIKASLKRAPGMLYNPAQFAAVFRNCGVKVIGANSATYEGLFFPDTYHYSDNERASELLTRACKKKRGELLSVWSSRAVGLPYNTPYQLLTAASIIEAEAALPRERPLVSDVIVNRLQRGMRLQMDSTVAYGVHHRLGYQPSPQQLRQDTRYNTYVHQGLPPTPIDSPGLASLVAAAHPAQTAYVYFVRAPNSLRRHIFTQSLGDHKRAVAHLRRSLVR